MYRNLFLILLAANLVFLGLQMVTAEDKSVRPLTSEDAEVPSLALVDESSAGREVPAPVTTAIEVNASAAPRRCLSLGPFSDERELAEARARLQAQELEGEVRHAAGRIWVGYWIFLPATETREEAIGRVEALRERGVRDIYIEPAGERENAVSLGVFSERNRAQRRYREIRELGFQPQIARRTREGTVFWLDFEVAEDLRIDPADFQVAAGRIVRLASRTCPL